MFVKKGSLGFHPEPVAPMTFLHMSGRKWMDGCCSELKFGGCVGYRTGIMNIHFASGTWRLWMDLDLLFPLVYHIQASFQVFVGKNKTTLYHCLEYLKA